MPSRPATDCECSGVGMKDFAVAISVYDKFEDVKILADIFRKNWKGNFHIVVCSSHPSAETHLAGCDIDELLHIENIPFSPAQFSQDQKQMHLTLRVVDSIRKACDRASRSEAPYTLHLHADSLPLSWPHLRSLGEAMRGRGKVFAARGYGFGYYVHDAPVGDFDDMFFVFDNAYAKTKRLWDFELVDFLPHKVSMHGFLALWGLARVGVRRFWHYSQQKDAVHWDGKPVVRSWLNSAHPMYFDPKYCFLHLHQDGFPDDLGPRLKAYYLKKYELTCGEALGTFLHKWDKNPGDLLDELRDVEERQRAFFHRWGLEYHGRDLARKERMIKEYERRGPGGKLMWLAARHRAQLRRHVGRIVHGRVIRGWIYRYRYGDMVWPSRLDALYRDLYHDDPNGPDELRDFPFGVQKIESEMETGTSA